MIDPCFSATHPFCGACRSHAARTRRCWLPRWCRIGTTVRTHIGGRRPGAADSAAPSEPLVSRVPSSPSAGAFGRCPARGSRPA